jgi:hypothetical protein
VIAKPESSPLPPKINLNQIDIYIFNEPLKTRVAAILSMAKDRANGGHASFQMIITF